MPEFELLRNITIGQYLPTGSVVHQLDPRVKLIVGTVLMAAVMATSNLMGMALALIAVLATLALVLTLALRFLPLLAREMERIMKAQAARGADFGTHSWNFLQRTRRMFPLLIPLFLISLRRAEELIEAMEARCYMGGRGRTHLIQLRAHTVDFVALGSVVVFAALLLATNFW